MHYLTLDTNTWIYLANGTEPARLLSFIKKEVDKQNITILLPKTIINEWDKNKDKAVKQGSLIHFKVITEALNRLLKLLGEKGEKDVFSFLLDEKDDKDYFKDFVNSFNKKRKEIEEAITDNIKLIDDLFKHPSTIIIEIQTEVFIKAGNFALEKKAPFKNKNSFADALIVFSTIDYVKTNSIEGALFISYNTDDFCEKKDGKKYLHPDLKPDFADTKSKFYTIVGEALNTIEKDIVSQEEIEWINEMQEEAKHVSDIDFCKICQVNNGRLNEINFGSPQFLSYGSKGLNYNDPNQTEFEFAKELPKSILEKLPNHIEVGHCCWCHAEHFRCVRCGAINAMWDDDYNKRKECEDCGLPYFIDSTGDNYRLGVGYEYSVLKYTLKCARCNLEFEDDGRISNICDDCEDESENMTN